MTTGARRTASTTKSRTKAQTMEKSQVVNYLLDNPDFFVEEQDLLSKLTLSRLQEGNIYNFSSCQVDYLQKQNNKLKQKSDYLLNLVRTNHKIVASIYDIVNIILTASTKAVLIDSFCKSWQEKFDLAANVFSLKQDATDSVKQDLFAKTPHETLYCGAIRSEESDLLFGKHIKANSAVIARFRHKKNQYMFIAIGSKDEDHFHAELDTSAFCLVQSVFQHQLNCLK